MVLQIRIHDSERDALRFQWRAGTCSEVETSRFTRVLFGLTPSPFMLGGVLECHLDAWAKKYPEEAERLRRNVYVDDLLTGGRNVQQAQGRKKVAQEIMSDATFELHKWHSNHPELEDKHQPENRAQLATEEQSYAKKQLQVQPSGPSCQASSGTKPKTQLRSSFQTSAARQPSERC